MYRENCWDDLARCSFPSRSHASLCRLSFSVGLRSMVRASDRCSGGGVAGCEGGPTGTALPDASSAVLLSSLGNRHSAVLLSRWAAAIRSSSVPDPGSQRVLYPMAPATRRQAARPAKANWGRGIWSLRSKDVTRSRSCPLRRIPRWNPWWRRSKAAVAAAIAASRSREVGIGRLSSSTFFNLANSSFTASPRCRRPPRAACCVPRACAKTRWIRTRPAPRRPRRAATPPR